MTHSRKGSACPRFTVGDKVRTKPGVNDLDFPDMPLGGWSGTITEMLVQFGAESRSGESFGGTCLYACRDGRWDADRLRPSESGNIGSAEAWLAKRKWRQLGA